MGLYLRVRCSTLRVWAVLDLCDWLCFQRLVFLADWRVCLLLVFLRSLIQSVLRRPESVWGRLRRSERRIWGWAFADGRAESSLRRNRFGRCSWSVLIQVGWLLLTCVFIRPVWWRLYESCFEYLQVHGHPVLFEAVFAFEERELLRDDGGGFKVMKEFLEE